MDVGLNYFYLKIDSLILCADKIHGQQCRVFKVLSASSALVEASGTIELKEMESVIGELFEMSGVSRGEGQARAVRSFIS